MDELLGVEVSHAICDLSSHLDHLLQSRWWTSRVVLRVRGQEEKPHTN